MTAPLEAWKLRLISAGLDGESIVSNTGDLIVARVGEAPCGPWLEVVTANLQDLHKRRPGTSLWAASRSVIPALVDLSGLELGAFTALMAQSFELLAATDDFRVEQQVFGALRQPLEGRVPELSAVIEGMRQLVAGGVEPGWFVQLVVPVLAKTVSAKEPFLSHWRELVAFALEVHRGSMHVGYPLSTGVAALLERGDLEALPRWLAALVPLVKGGPRSAYPLCEYALPPLAWGGLGPSELTDALQLALTMQDHGLPAGSTLALMTDPVALDLATQLASAGVDPAVVISNGIPGFASVGLFDDGGARLVRLAIALHQRGLRQLLFEDGLTVLPVLEQEFGLGARAVELVEAMVARDLEPGVIMRWSLPRVLPYLRPGWAPGEVLRFALRLVEVGVSPEPAVSYAARPLVELSTDVEAFRRLTEGVVALVGRLAVDHREALFQDVARLAEAGQQSQAFVDLLASLSKLLETWTASKLELSPLLSVAIPAAAREAQGKPWVLAIGLNAANRLASEGRSAEALTLLEVGVGTAAKWGASGSEDFDRALTALETRYAALPASLTAPASLAASTLAGTEVGLLAQTLAVIAAAHARHGASLEAMASALPDLARVARTPDELAPLIDALVREGEDLDAPALASIVAGPCRDAASGVAALQSLALCVRATPAQAPSLQRFGRLSRVVKPNRLAEVFTRFHDAFTTATERRLLLDLLELACDEGTLVRMCELLGAALADPKPALVDGLSRAKELLRLPFGWTHLVSPALTTAGPHAGLLLSVLRSIPARHLELEADVVVLQQLITQRGVKAVDLLWSLVIPALHRGLMPSLSAHQALLETYLRDVGFFDAEVYEHFVRIMSDDDLATRKARIGALTQAVQELTRAIHAGDVSGALREHPLFGVALQHVFPASVSATREEWEALVKQMPDRPADVTALFPNGHRASLRFAAGAWHLTEGAQGLEVFAWCARVLPTPETPVQPLEALGWQLLTAWAEGRLARAPLKWALAQALLAHLPTETLPGAEFDSAAQVLAIRQLASDHLSSLVEQALLAARASDSARVERLIRARLAPASRIGPGLVKAITGTLRAIDEGTLSAIEGERRLRAQLQAFELPDGLLAALREPSALSRLTPRQTVIEPGKEVARVHAELVGQELQEMSTALSKALEYRASSEAIEVEVTVTKRAVHSPIGFTTGVCVARDLELWNTPHFMHLALWLDGVCVGGVHLLVLEEGGRRRLALPGINPSTGLLERVEAEVFVKVLLEHLRGLAKSAGLEGLWIPVAPSIHSNRRAVGEALAALALPSHRSAGHAFSFSPFAYRIDDVWVA